MYTNDFGCKATTAIPPLFTTCVDEYDDFGDPVEALCYDYKLCVAVPDEDVGIFIVCRDGAANVSRYRQLKATVPCYVVTPGEG